MTQRRLLYFVAEDWFFCSHRLPLARAAVEAGYRVGLVTRVGKHADVIRAAGIELLPIDLSRSGVHPLREFATLRAVIAAYRRFQPDIVHHVAIKPVVYGSLASRLAGRPAVVNALAGLGYLFTSRRAGARHLRRVVERALKLALKGDHRWLIVQNPDDLALVTMRGLVDTSHTEIIRGSGVDVSQFAPSPEPDAVPLVVLPARMLRDKGIAEFVDAARSLKQNGVQARFALVGDSDSENPSAVPRDQLEAWQREGCVEWWGWRDDMTGIFASANIVCLPSHREGLPKSLLEAAACARAIVTCDVPGCREVVKDGINGLLVPASDAPALAAALHTLLDDPGLRRRMGTAGREIVMREFSIERVIAQTLALYARAIAST